MKKLNLRQQLLVGGAMLAVIPMLVLGTFTVLRTMKTFIDFGGYYRTICGKALRVCSQPGCPGNTAGTGHIRNGQHRPCRRQGGEEDEASKDDIESLDKEFTVIEKLGDQYSGIYLTDKDGLFLAGARSGGDNAPYKNMNVSDRDYFRDAKQGNGNVGSLIKAKTNNQPVMIACTPVFSEKGHSLVFWPQQPK